MTINDSPPINGIVDSLIRRRRISANCDLGDVTANRTYAAAHHLLECAVDSLMATGDWDEQKFVDGLTCDVEDMIARTAEAHKPRNNMEHFMFARDKLKPFLGKSVWIESIPELQGSDDRLCISIHDRKGHAGVLRFSNTNGYDGRSNHYNAYLRYGGHDHTDKLTELLTTAKVSRANVQGTRERFASFVHHVYMTLHSEVQRLDWRGVLFGEPEETKTRGMNASDEAARIREAMGVIRENVDGSSAGRARKRVVDHQLAVIEERLFELVGE